MSMTRFQMLAGSSVAVGIAHRAVAIVFSAALLSLSCVGSVGLAQNPSPQGIPEDDPFADELNPFGAGKAAPSTRQPDPPPAVPPRAPQLPMPFPEKTLPGDPAETRPSRSQARDQAQEQKREQRRDQKAEPPTRTPGMQQPDSALRGLEPFPEAEGQAPDDGEMSEAERLLVEAEKLDKQGRYKESREILRKVVKLDPKMSIGYLALGVVCRRLGDFEGSVAACSKGLRVDPENAELYLRRGIAWFHLGLHGIALEDFEDAAGIAYDDPRPELWRGLTLIELGRPLEAINAYASAIRRDRSYMVAYLNRGLAYLSTNEPRKAEFDFDLAIRHDPRDVRAWFNRGVAQARQGRYADAVESYAAALKLDPSHEPSRRNLAAAEQRVGRTVR